MTDMTHADRNGGVYLVSAARTPIGKFGGALADVPAVELGGVAIRAAVERSGLPADVPIDEVLMGQVLQAGAGQAPARQAALRGGLPVTTSATTINRVCGSALKAIMLGAAEIRAGDAEVVVAGGMESMNGAPYLLPRARFGYRLGNGTLVDATVHDGLWCAIEGCHMGTHAERVAISNEVSRAGPGRVRPAQPPAGRSRPSTKAASRPRSRRSPSATRRAARRSSPSTRVPAGTRRSRPWPGSSRPSRCPTARTAATRPTAPSRPATRPGITDGAAATVVVSERTVERYGLKPLARIIGYAQAEVEPKWLFLAPVEGVRRLLDRIEMPIEAFDLIEINEAFAAQTLADGRELGFDWDKVNVNGGAIALGPPDRRVRSPDRRDAAPRAPAARGPLRARDPLPRWRRLGGDGLRAGLTAAGRSADAPRDRITRSPARSRRRSRATTSRDRRRPRSPDPAGRPRPSSRASRATAIAIARATARSRARAGRAPRSAIDRPTRDRPARWAATRNMSSVTSRASATIAPRPTPGKMKTLFAWPMTRSPAGAGDIATRAARRDEGSSVGPGEDVVRLCLGAAPGFDSGRMIGTGSWRPTSRTSASEKAPAQAGRADQDGRPVTRAMATGSVSSDGRQPGLP